MRSSINVIIPAAGAATRLRPLSSNVSKAMVRVNGKPCIDFILEQIQLQHDIAEVVIVDGQFNDLRSYVPKRWKNLNVSFVKQLELNGPRQAILLGAEELQTHELPLVVWLGDAIILDEELNLTQDMLLCKEVEDHHNWCMWDGNHFYDKPESYVENGVALVGLYCFSNGVEAYRSFTQTRGYDISHALKYYAKNTTNFEKRITSEWYDIGDISNYYKTCASLLNLKSRSFNQLSYDPDLHILRKSVDPRNFEAIETLRVEKNWYTMLDWKQQMFTPRYIPNPSSLMLSYEPGILLSDLLLYEDLPTSTWTYLIDRVFFVMTKYFHRRDDIPLEDMPNFVSNLEIMWVDKSYVRLNQLDYSENTKNVLREYIQEIVNKVEPIQGMHGDLHLGNILFSAQNDKITLLDPRGKYGNIIGTYGDNLYDWAKMAHDLVFGYNHLVANVPYTRQKEMSKIFESKCKEYNIDLDLAVKGGLVLLATCIPLHSDDKARQERMKNVVEEYCNRPG